MGFLPFLGVRVSLLLVVQVVGAPSLCVQVRVCGMLANLPTFRLVDLSTCRVVGLLAGSGDGGEVVLWRVSAGVFWRVVW